MVPISSVGNIADDLVLRGLKFRSYTFIKTSVPKYAAIIVQGLNQGIAHHFTLVKSEEVTFPVKKLKISVNFVKYIIRH